MKPTETTTPLLRNSINRSPLQRGFLLIPLALALVLFGLLPTAQAVSPAPDGGYANDNTAEGTNALFSLTAGIQNTATGFEVLFKNTTGNFNTANGAFALQNNTTGSGNTANGVEALLKNTIGNSNTANGFSA